MKSIIIALLALLLICSAVARGGREGHGSHEGPGGSGGSRSSGSSGGSGGHESTRPEGHDNQEDEREHKTIAEKIATLSADENTFVTCVSVFLQTNVGFAEEPSQIAAFEYMKYYQHDTTLTPTDTSGCGAVPAHETETETVTATEPAGVSP
mmetsp:Transcript_11955/g.13592  ORF Transcript_11955/g.13592 Transcript_11955/m.13592 type:complete len:152 (-) Transcript_11955:36-491(-)